MSKHIVYGNGESRPRKPIVGGDFITWGCNAIYRDFVLDNLVSVDYNMQQEIYESGYAIRNKCWFSDWSILPDFDVDVIKMERLVIYGLKKHSKQSMHNSIYRI